jgi:hypothetical protein
MRVDSRKGFRMRASLRLFAVVILGLTAGACGGSTTQPENSRTSATPADPERSRRLDEARRDQSIQLGEGPSDDKYWLEFAKLESEGTPGTR